MYLTTPYREAAAIGIIAGGIFDEVERHSENEPWSIDPYCHGSNRIGLNFAVLACFPPKVHYGTQTLRCLICDVSYRSNKLRG
jgi:hypothetical protein